MGVNMKVIVNIKKVFNLVGWMTYGWWLKKIYDKIKEKIA